jgi:hypothetical protein
MRDTTTKNGVQASPTPNPAEPKVRDAFITEGGERVTIAVVGKEWTLVHYPDGSESPRLRQTVATWTPAPPPLITEDVVLRKWTGPMTGRQFWMMDAVPWAEGAITLHPNHTWSEGAA